MPVQMRLLYCESIEMSFDRAKCFQLRTEITNAHFWALQYKPEGRGFDFRLTHWIFHCLKSPDRIMVQGQTQK
jgi:hypothetical protein